MNRAGVLYALGAYLTWGAAPLFWKALDELPSTVVLSHRVVWALLFFGALLIARGRGGELRSSVSLETLSTFAASALLLGFNWFLFIYSVIHDQVLQASLGYFINPLVNVVLGMVFLRERLRPLQWLAVGLAGFGVALQTVSTGTVPWLSLGLAMSFGFYGLVRKTARADALLGSTWEALLLLLPALGFLVFRTLAEGQPFFVAPMPIPMLLVLGGAVTAVPLLCFSNAARRLPLSTLGFFQYLAPTCQFLIAVLVFREPFSVPQLVAFVSIWLALTTFLGESLRRAKRAPLAGVA